MVAYTRAARDGRIGDACAKARGHMERKTLLL